LKEGEAGSTQRVDQQAWIGRATLLQLASEVRRGERLGDLNMASPNFSGGRFASQSDKEQELRSPNLLKTGAAHLPTTYSSSIAVYSSRPDRMTAVIARRRRDRDLYLGA